MCGKSDKPAVPVVSGLGSKECRVVELFEAFANGVQVMFWTNVVLEGIVYCGQIEVHF